VAEAYAVRRAPRSETCSLRGLDIHLTRWGPPPAPGETPIVLLHGWQDNGDTFQFLVDAFQADWPLLAPDWRGFGRSAWPSEGYWFPDYFADLEALLDRFAPSVPVRLVGHSMGGNIASQYAGLRPDRVRCVANLEGFGLPRTIPDKAPDVLRKWLDQVKLMPPLKQYESLQQLESVIRHRYPRFTGAQAAFVAAAWSEPHGGGVRLLGDPRHRWINPVRYKREDAEAIWRQATAPMMMVLGDESEYLPALGEDGTEAGIRRIMPTTEVVRVAGAGHMLHIEKADRVAPLVERFLGAH
jgi:pimeloyl-ACP methyl ester carboxylesterase